MIADVVGVDKLMSGGVIRGHRIIPDCDTAGTYDPIGISYAVYLESEYADVCLNCNSIACTRGNCARINQEERRLISERKGHRRKRR